MLSLFFGPCCEDHVAVLVVDDDYTEAVNLVEAPPEFESESTLTPAHEPKRPPPSDGLV